MCFVLAVATREFAIVAADTQHTYTPVGGGPAERLDWGGKLLSLRNGWASGTGHSERLMVALETLRPLDFRDMVSVRTALARSHRETAGRIGATFPDNGGNLAHVFGVQDTGRGYAVQVVRSDGEPHSSGEGFYMNWPPEIDTREASAERLRRSMALELKRTRTSPLLILRTVAEVAAYSAERARTMSTTLEAGFCGSLNGYLRAPIADLLNETADTLRERIKGNSGAETAGRVMAARQSFEAWKLNLMGAA